MNARSRRAHVASRFEVCARTEKREADARAGRRPRVLEASPGAVAAEEGLESREAAVWFRALVEQIPAITYTEIDDPLSETGTSTSYVTESSDEERSSKST